MKLVITEKAGVVISAKHIPCGTELELPPGTAKALLHFKQAKEVGAIEIVSAPADVGGGSPQEDFVAKLKLLLVTEYSYSEEEATDAIKAQSDIVIDRMLGGTAGLQGTAKAVDLAEKNGGVTAPATVAQANQPSARFIPQAGTGGTGGAAVNVVQPTAGYTGPVNVGGSVATPVTGAVGAAPGANPVPELGRTEVNAENAAVNAAAEKPLKVVTESLEELDAMTVQQLKDLARDRNISLEGASLKADIIKVIRS